MASTALASRDLACFPLRRPPGETGIANINTHCATLDGRNWLPTWPEGRSAPACRRLQRKSTRIASPGMDGIRAMAERRSFWGIMWRNGPWLPRRNFCCCWALCGLGREVVGILRGAKEIACRGRRTQKAPSSRLTRQTEVHGAASPHNALCSCGRLTRGNDNPWGGTDWNKPAAKTAGATFWRARIPDLESKTSNTGRIAPPRPAETHLQNRWQNQAKTSVQKARFAIELHSVPR